MKLRKVYIKRLKDCNYQGEGIKKMKAYTSKFNKGNITKMRKEFWAKLETRVEGDKEIWELLRAFCETIEENNVSLYLEAAGIKLYNKCINKCYDSKGFLNEIPNYCVNEPYKFELEIANKRTSSNEKLILEIRYYNKSIYISTEDKQSTISLKKKISELLNKEINRSKESNEDIKIYYGGQELNDNYDLC